MKAAEITKKNELHYIDLSRPVPREDEILMEVMASGICGTDVHIYQGDYKGTYPIVPGHEFSGVIREVGSKVKNFSIGDRVSIEPNLSCGTCYDCLNNRQHFCSNVQSVGVTRPGGMAQFVCVPEQAVFPIGDLSFEEASFMEPLSCVLHGIEQVKPGLADSVLLMGAGPIGLLLMQSFLVKGCSKVDVIDKDESRLAMASALGASEVSSRLEDFEKESYHIVCDATGVSFLMEETLNYVRPSGRILWFAVPHVNDVIKVPPFRLFAKEISIFSSYTSCRNSWQALDLLKNGRIEVKGLISHKLPLNEFDKGLQILMNHSEPAMKIIMMPQEESK